MATCICTALTVDDDGRLCIVPEGSPADLAWPYPCPVGTNNSLRRQTGGGLFVAPPTLIGKLRTTGTLAHAPSAVPAANLTVVNAVIQMPNPSSCHTAEVILWVEAQVDFALPPGADSRAAMRINGDELFRLENPAPANGTNMTWQPQATKTVSTGLATIPPGGSTLYTIPIDVGAGQGGATYGDVRWSVTAIAFAQE